MPDGRAILTTRAEPIATELGCAMGRDIARAANQLDQRVAPRAAAIKRDIHRVITPGTCWRREHAGRPSHTTEAGRGVVEQGLPGAWRSPDVSTERISGQRARVRSRQPSYQKLLQ